MPRCSTHCPPPRSSGALLLAVIVAGVVTIAAGKTRSRARRLLWRSPLASSPDSPSLA